MGLFGNFGMKVDDDLYYFGVCGIKFYLWLGFVFVKKVGCWVMVVEFVEMSWLYVCCFVKIEFEWVEKIGVYLLKKLLLELYWEKCLV